VSPESGWVPNSVAVALPAVGSAGDAAMEIGGTLSPELAIPPQRLVQSPSFSHFAELIGVDEPIKRRFYENECLRGSWSARELKRQIASPYYERTDDRTYRPYHTQTAG
jgi:hypothetical protein